MIIHLSHERNKRILEQGFKLEVPEQLQEDPRYQHGDTVYHLLSGERATCNLCGKEYESLPVSTPVELELAKTVLGIDPNISIEDLRKAVIEINDEPYSH